MSVEVVYSSHFGSKSHTFASNDTNRGSTLPVGSRADIELDPDHFLITASPSICNFLSI